MFLAKYLRAFDWDIEKSLEIMLKMYKIRVSAATTVQQTEQFVHHYRAHCRSKIPPGLR